MSEKVRVRARDVLREIERDIEEAVRRAVTISDPSANHSYIANKAVNELRSRLSSKTIRVKARE